ncbi:MAG: hypothetical protein H6573_35275 [Lewinellaceae bacterium]|nr:hypothetical protein [Lewinellaceae bacterium]
MKRSQTRTSRSWRDADWWAQLLSGHEESGQSVKEYCAAQGVSAASFYRWQKRLEQEKGVGFSPIEIETKPVGGLVVELPCGVALHFSELPPVAYLRSLSSSFSGSGI